MALEIFDEDDSDDAWFKSPQSTFRGSPRGCDSNNDKKVEVSDIICTARTFFGLTCNAPVSAAAAALPVVTTPGAILARPGLAVAVPVQFTANGNAIASMAFTLNFDPSQFTFDPADNDLDGLPDAITLPAANGLFRMAAYDAAHGRLRVLVAGVVMPLPLLADGQMVTVELSGSPGATAQLGRLTLTDVSLGGAEGQAVPAESGSTSGGLANQLFMPFVQQTSRIFLPLVKQE